MPEYLPDKIWEHSVSIQYAPPKWLNPSEVWLLYNLKSYSTNFDCLLYKWEYEWLIKIEDRWNWSIMIHKNKEISNDVPSYEKQFWSMIFKVGFKDMVVWKWNQSNLDRIVISNLHLKLLDYCVEQWIIYKSYDYLFFASIIWVFWGGFIFWYVSWVTIILFSFVYIFYYLWKQGNYLWMKIWRTKKWDELYVHIIGYKYWLEKCEEWQVKALLKGDPWFKSRNFPYLVALRTDSRFLNGKFNE